MQHLSGILRFYIFPISNVLRKSSYFFKRIYIIRIGSSAILKTKAMSGEFEMRLHIKTSFHSSSVNFNLSFVLSSRTSISLCKEREHLPNFVIGISYQPASFILVLKSGVNIFENHKFDFFENRLIQNFILLLSSSKTVSSTV